MKGGRRHHYGAAALLREDRKPELFQVFMVTLTATIIIFFLDVTLVCFGTFFHRNPVIVSNVIGAIACVVLVRKKDTIAYFLPLGLSLICAIISSIVVGLLCYDLYGYFAYLYSNTRTYTNVVASESAAAVADAGRLVFATEAHVDVDDGVGFAGDDGERYCVAPVRDLVESNVVEFWAVGYGCCAWTGMFDCDQAGDPSAHGGIVVLDNLGLFGSMRSNRDRYDKARRKAEALFDLIPSTKPVYVRWVNEANLGMLISYYSEKSWIFIICATFLFTFLAAPCVWLVCQWSMGRSEALKMQSGP